MRNPNDDAAVIKNNSGAEGAWTTTTVTVNSPGPQQHMLDGLKKKVRTNSYNTIAAIVYRVSYPIIHRGFSDKF